MAEQKGGFIDVNGVKTYYVESGQGASAPIVFVHGWSLDLTYWQPEIEYFSKARRVMAYDWRGTGKSGGEKQKYEFEQLVEDLRTIMSQLNIERPVLCGHSLGGSIVAQYCATYRNDVSALVLADTPGQKSFMASPLGYGVLRLALAVESMLHPVKGPLPAMVPLAQCLMYSAQFRKSQPSAMAGFARHFESNSVTALLNASRALGFSQNVTPMLRQVTAPGFLIRGSKDFPISQKQMEQYRSSLQGSELFLIDGSGHMTLDEQPGVFCRAMAEFLVKHGL